MLLDKMTKVLFSADLHLKLNSKNIPKEWQKNRFRLLYEELYKLEEKVDIHIIGGDIFDSVPSLEELELFAEFLYKIKIPTILFSGNHEATKKGHTFFEQLKPIFERLNSKIEVILGTSEIEGMDIIPYEDLKTFNPKDFSNKILLTHCRGNIEPHVKAEVDLAKFDRWEIVYAGDLHSHTNSQRNIAYPGSPLTTTFHRSPTKTGVIIFDTEKPKEYKWIELKLPQLIRKTVDSEDLMVPTSYDHTIYELCGDLVELSKAKKVNPLLDKKVVKRKVESTIDFSNLASIEEELIVYLIEVKGMKATDDTMRVYNDNI